MSIVKFITCNKEINYKLSNRLREKCCGFNNGNLTITISQKDFNNNALTALTVASANACGAMCRRFVSRTRQVCVKY